MTQHLPHFIASGVWPAWRLALALFLPISAFGHGPLNERLAAATVAIEADPARGALYAARASLHLEHNDCGAALADLERARALGSDDGAIALLTVRTLSMQRDYDHALETINAYVQDRPTDVQGYIARADLLARMGRYREAAQDLSEAIRRKGVPDAGLFLTQARYLEHAGDPDAARECLAGGYAGLPESSILRHALCESMIRTGHMESALNMLDALGAESKRKERWLTRRAEVLAEMGRRPDALVSARQAVASIRSLPARHRETPAMQSLSRRILNNFPELQPRISATANGAGGRMSPE